MVPALDQGYPLSSGAFSLRNLIKHPAKSTPPRSTSQSTPQSTPHSTPQSTPRSTRFVFYRVYGTAQHQSGKESALEAQELAHQLPLPIDDVHPPKQFEFWRERNKIRELRRSCSVMISSVCMTIPPSPVSHVLGLVEVLSACHREEEKIPTN
jgi:hypothetical protein